MEARDQVLHGIREALACQDRPDSNEHVWTAEQHWEAFNYLFMDQGLGLEHHKHNDDLLFFVHAARQPAAGAPLDPGPFSVRRRGKQMTPEWGLSGSNFAAISWEKTLLLNIVLQTEFVLTVIVCR